jgi:divalent metal cation (Fe/Co/Zn/Cd) transporter
VADELGRPPRDLRFLQTDEGLYAFLTLSLDPGETLAAAHAQASRVEERIRAACPRVAELIVHTEP